MEKTKIYSPMQVGSAAFWGGPCGAVFLFKKNFDALGNKTGSRQTAIWGTVYIVLFFLAVIFLPHDAARALVAANVGLAWLFTRKYQLPTKDILKSEQYGLQSNWKVFGIICASAVATSILTAILIVAFMGVGTSNSVSDITDSVPNYTETIQKAQAGDAAAQYDLGMAYYNDAINDDKEMGSDEHKEAAVKWLRKSADQGYAEAQGSLGLAYRSVLGMTKDSAEAITWLQKAADQGNTEAQLSLGMAYQNGWGVMKNLTQAQKWLQKAADQGDLEVRTQAKAQLGEVRVDELRRNP